MKLATVINKLYHIINKKGLRSYSKSSLRILIINPQGYGDTIVLTPTIKALKNKLKECKIYVIVSEKGNEVLENCAYVDKLFLYNGNVKEYYELIKKIRRLNIDICFDLQITLTSFRRWFFPLLTGSKNRIYFKRGGFRGVLPHSEVEYPSHHMIENYLKIISGFTNEISDKNPEVYFSKQDTEWAKNKLNKNKKKTILIHTHSENKNHLWQTDKWVNVAEELNKNNSVIFTSPKEGINYVKGIVNKMKNKAEIIVPDTFNKLAALTAESDLLITIDTSIVHISSATKTPAIIIYGPTILNFWGPINQNQIALQKEVVCYGKCREYDMTKIFASQEFCQDYEDNCINYITEEEVIQESENVLK